MRQAAEILMSAVKWAQEAAQAREAARRRFLDDWKSIALQLIRGTTWRRRSRRTSSGHPVDTQRWLVATQEATARLQSGVPFDRGYGWGQVLALVQPEYSEIAGRGFELVPGTWIAVNDCNEDRNCFVLHGETEPFAKDFGLQLSERP